jgi:antitoxin VbhA-like protein
LFPNNLERLIHEAADVLIGAGLDRQIDYTLLVGFSVSVQFVTPSSRAADLSTGYPHTYANNKVVETAMTTLTGQEVQRNMRSVAHAIAQQELEGLKVPDSTVADLRRAARGEIDTDEVIRNICRQLKNAPIFRA